MSDQSRASGHAAEPGSTQWVIAALERHHAPNKGWVTVPEVTVASGFGTLLEGLPPHSGSQRIDLFAMGTWKTTGYERVAYEIKVSRSDWLRELKKPEKREAAKALSHRFVIAAPAGLVKRSELPPDCGLVEVRDNGSAYTYRKGPRRPDPVAPPEWIASLLRTAAEQRSMGWRCAAHNCHGRGVATVRVTGTLFAFCRTHEDLAGVLRERALTVPDLTEGASDE